MDTVRLIDGWRQAVGLTFVLAFGSVACAGAPDPKDPYLRDPDSVATNEADMKP
jgi:hypothetical protein